MMSMGAAAMLPQGWASSTITGAAAMLTSRMVDNLRVFQAFLILAHGGFSG
jgi:hypothetical protein